MVLSFLFGNRAARRTPPARRSGFVPQLTALEDREVPAVYFVTNTSDDANVRGSLRWAVTQANYTTRGLDFVHFRLPAGGSKTITVSDTIYLNDQVVIDGTTQPGYAGEPLVQIRGAADRAVPSIFLLGFDTSLGVVSSGSTIQGLNITSYAYNAVTVFPQSLGNWVQNNWLGFSRTAAGGVELNRTLFPQPTYASAGVGIQSSFNTIRGNTIAGVYNGIILGEAIERTWSGSIYKTNSIQGNFIGTDPTGTTAQGYGNESDGIFLASGAQQNFIGPGNVVSGNGSDGVELLAASNVGNVVFQNKIGTDVSGTRAIGNAGIGVFLAGGAHGNAVGGPFGGNVISGNAGAGVALGTGLFGGADYNFVQYNIIGLNGDQSAAIGTQNTGVSVDTGSRGNVIEGNVIGGMKFDAILFANASGNRVSGNWIGTNAFNVWFPNDGYAIQFLAGGSFNFISGNLITYNKKGVYAIDPNAVGNFFA